MADKEPVASTVTGTIGTVCWCIQLIPQIWMNWRNHSTEGVPLLFAILWAIAGVPLAAYFLIIQPSLALQVQPIIFTFLCTIWTCQVLHYQYKQSTIKCIGYFTIFGMVFTGIITGLVFGLRQRYQMGEKWVVIPIGVFSAVFIIAGLLPPYYEIYKRNGQVVGLNFIFLAIDFTGAAFSMASLLTQVNGIKHPDALSLIQYVGVMVLELGIFLLQGIWLLRVKLKSFSDEEEEASSELGN